MTDADMTIRDVRVTILRMPWANPDWIKGHALGPDRGVLIVDVETAGGVTGMGYLFHFRPGLKSIATFIEEVIVPRVKGKDATSIEAIWHDLWKATMTYGRGGIAAMAMSEKKSAPPVRASTWPRMVKGITTTTATCRIAPMMLLTSSPR